MGQFSVFARGEIVGMARVGTPPSTIVKLVRKTNKKRATVRAVQQTIAKRKADAEWEGERKPGSGRPPVLFKKLANKIVKLVFKMRGKEVVTRAYCKNQIPELRKIGKNILSRALHAAGLAWLRRNRNRKVPVAALGPRRCYARWVLRQSVKVLKNFVYVDGTTFYLALNETGAEDQAPAIGTVRLAFVLERRRIVSGYTICLFVRSQARTAGESVGDARERALFILGLASEHR